MSETALAAQAPDETRQLDFPALTGAQKAAVILSLLDPDNARSLAEGFDDGAADKAIEAFQNLRVVDKRVILETIATFVAAVQDDVPVVAGGMRRAEQLAEALAPQSFEMMDMMDMASGFEGAGSIDEGADAEAVWTYVRELEPIQLATLIGGERPAVIAAVVQRLDKKSGSSVLGQLEQDTAVQVVKQVMTGKQPAPRTYDAIAESLRRNAGGRLSEAEAPEGDPSEQLAEMFNCLPAAKQDAILEPLRTELPEETKRVEERLMRFGLLHERLPKTFVPTIFREAPQDVLDRALKHGLEHQTEAADFLLGSISQRLAEQIRERIDEMRKISQTEGETAQTELLGLLFGWAEEGRFEFKEEEDFS
ncbi:MAG: FliG C-terminal domain-containing protein [Pseudomonadota bacterium]